MSCTYDFVNDTMLSDSGARVPESETSLFRRVRQTAALRSLQACTPLSAVCWLAVKVSVGSVGVFHVVCWVDTSSRRL